MIRDNSLPFVSLPYLSLGRLLNFVCEGFRLRLCYRSSGEIYEEDYFASGHNVPEKYIDWQVVCVSSDVKIKGLLRIDICKPRGADND